MKILIAEEKYGTRYLRASTPEELQESGLKLLKERDSAGYWYYREQNPKWFDAMKKKN